MDMSERPRVDIEMVDPFAISEIIDKDNFQEKTGITKDICDPKVAYSGVKEIPLPVDFSGLPDARIMEVAPGTSVPEHSHDGPVFRLITEGEAIVNGKSYNKGDWMVIPSRGRYAVESPTGYTALWNCAKC